MKKQGKFFKQIFIIYFSFTVVLLALISQIIYGYTSTIIEEEVKKNSQYLLKQAQIYTEEKIMNDVFSIINSNFINIPIKTNLSDFFEEDTETRDYPFITTELKALIQQKDYFTNMGLYNSQKDHYISLKNGLVLSPTNMPYKMHDFNLERIKSYLSQFHNRDLTHSYKKRGQFIYNESYDDSAIYLQPLPLFGKEKPTDFLVLFIDLKADSISSHINELFNQRDTNFYILNPSLQVLQSNNSNETNYKNTLPLSNNSFAVVDSVHGEFLVSWVQSPLTSWYYIYEESYHSFLWKINELRWFVALIIFAFLILTFICMVVITRRIYKPVNHLVLAAEKFAPYQDKEHNEFDFINTTLDHMDLRVQEVLVKNHALMEYKILTDFFFGSITEEDLEERLAILQRPVNKPKFNILLMAIPEPTFSSLEYLELELMVQQVGDRVSHFFGNGNSIFSLNNPHNQLIYVLNHDYTTGELQERLLSLQQSILESHIRLFGILSETYDHLGQLHRAYNKSKKLLAYSILYSETRLQTSKHLLEMKKRSYDYTSSHKNVDEYLKAKNYDRLQTYVSYELEDFEHNGYNPDHMRSFLSLVTTSLWETLINYHLVDKSTPTLNDKHGTDYTLKDYRTTYQEWLSILSHHHKQRYDGAEVEFINHLLQFMMQHVNADLSLQTLSTKFGMSQSHLSKIFKKHLGINISKYILDQKLNKAARQITEQPDKDIQTIAAELGYYTPSYFSKLFKQKFGLTPGKYRLENTGAEISQESC